MTSGTSLPLPYSIKRHGISLSNCDDEPVQTPGCIQARGLLLTLPPGDLVVTQVSENCERWTALPAGPALGRRVSEIVGLPAAERIQALTRTEALDHNPCHALTVGLRGAPADAAPMDLTIHPKYRS